MNVTGTKATRTNATHAWPATAGVLAVVGAILVAGCAGRSADLSNTTGSPGTQPVTAAATGPIPAYRLDPTHTFVHWNIVHMGTSTIRGRFDTATGNVGFDPRGKRLDVSITIDTASVYSGVKLLDDKLKGPELLSVAAHPKAYFVARDVPFDGDALREVRGELTLGGISQPLTLRSTRWHCGLNLVVGRTVCGGDFEAELLRSDYGITYALPLVPDKVGLQIEVEAIAP